MKLLLAASAFFLSCVAADHHTVLQLHGSGTTNPSKCYWSIMEDLTEQASLPVRLSYRAVGSTTGIKEFADSFLKNDSHTVFGSGDLPISQERYDEINDGGTQKFIHLPVLAGAVSFFHSVPGSPHLNLTACLLGQIYQSKITSWGDPKITAINPNLSTEAKNTPITVGRRIKGSSSTNAITNYLNVACDVDGEKLPADLTGPEPTWPDHSNFEKCRGSAGMTKCIRETDGFIGYIDAGHGVSAGLPEVRLHNKESNVYRTSQDSSISDAIKRSELPSSADESFADVSFLNVDGQNTWPIVLMTYVYVRKNLPEYIEEPQEQALLIAYLRALYEELYVGECEKLYGFTSLANNDEVKAFAEEAINDLEATVSDEATEWYFELETNAITGAGEYVISVNRRSSADVKIEELNNDVADLQDGQVTRAEIAALKLELKQLEQAIDLNSKEIQDLRSSAPASDTMRLADADSMTYTEQDDIQLKAAVALSTISFVFWMFWIAAYVYRCVNGESDAAN